METILITGASSGIGREMAIRFSENYKIVLVGRNLGRLTEVRNMCSRPEDHLIWQYDLSQIRGIEEAYLSFARSHQLEVNNLVCCAGMIKTYPIKMVTADTITEMFNTNVFASFLLTKVLVNKRINGDALCNIVYISSNISNFGAKAHSMYSSSKAAVDGMMRSLAVELAPHVRVNSVLPGGIRTPMTEHIYKDEQLAERINSTYPLGLGQTSDIYGAVKFLLSEDARWITGQQITVDGGRTINITG